MGVAGAAGVLSKQGHRFSQWITLKDTKLIFDVTDALAWLVKKHLPSRGARPYLYGSNMVALTSFYRDLFKRFRERNITPVIVFAGGRLFEQTHGSLASKTQHFERSARAALSRINNHQFRDLNALPDLAQNALKEVINEFNFEHIHQATYEVYPLLERLADEHQCPVMSSHSDFMFAHAKHGFIWTDTLELPLQANDTSRQPIRALLCRRDQLLSYFSGLSVGAEGAVRSLYILLRDDFAERHYDAVSNVLRLPMDLRLRPTRDRQKTRRLLHILNNWPPYLTTLESVQRSLSSQPSRGIDLERDFRSLNESFSLSRDLFHVDNHHLVRSFLPAQLSVDQFAAACLRRESSPQFMMELRQMVNINRCQTIEDLRLLKSTWSLGDRARQYLLGQLQLDQLKLFDRRYAQADYRSIRPLSQQQSFVQLKQPPKSPKSPKSPSSSGEFSESNLFALFHFNRQSLDHLASMLQERLRIDVGQSKHLALLLLLERFAYKLAFRANYDNSDPDPSAPPAARQQSLRLSDAASQSASLPSNTSSGAPEPETGNTNSGNTTTATTGSHNSLVGDYVDLRSKRIFFTALVNSFVFYSNDRQAVGDSTRQDIPADIRVARAKMDEFLLSESNLPPGSLGDMQYFQIKHKIEMLNSVLHYYKELNSLYEFVGPNFLVNRFYDANLVYQLTRRWSNNLAEHLLSLDENIMRLLNE